MNGARYIPLDRCLARPSEGNRRYPLVEHLLEVAYAAGDPAGSPADQLLFLAGLLHDIGKARRSWQERLLDPGRHGPAGPHAFVGAALFAGLTFRWLRAQGRPFAREGAPPGSGAPPVTPPALPPGGMRGAGGLTEDLILAVGRDIADHHGLLGDLDPQAPWLSHWTPSVLDEMDVPALLALLRETRLPVSGGLWPRDAAELTAWVEAARSAWGRAVIRLEARRRQRVDPVTLLRDRTARLIVADRFAVGRVDPEFLAAEQAEVALRTMAQRLAGSGSAASRAGLRGVPGGAVGPHAGQQGTSPDQPAGSGPPGHVARRAAGGGISGERRRIQEEVLARYRRRPREPIYTLVLPTGSGKTLTAFRVALEAVRLNGRRRIVYAGPYLTVVEQASQQLEALAGLPVMQHHHLAVPDPDPAGPGGDGEPEGAGAGDEERALLLLESWQAPVVAVTFNQLFRALFPRRAQHTLRIPALAGAFVILDEPQIIDPGSWAIFTELLAAAASSWDMQVLIMTATMPPWCAQALAPCDLSVPARLPSRYRLRVGGEGSDEVLDAAALASRLVRDALAGYRVAAILNTIADAGAVYREVRRLWSAATGPGHGRRGEGLAAAAGEAGDEHAGTVLALHGLMVPAHKARNVSRLRGAMEAGGPVIAVATQALEAGVDLDFDRLYRARPVLPSVLQAAGRANRHGLREAAEVRVFTFRRDDGKDSRPWVYRDAIAREETDRILVAGAEWDERDLDRTVEAYYQRLLERKPGRDAEGALAEAAAGRWSVLGGLMPFDEGPPRIPLFVPRDDLLDPGDRASLQEWGVGSLRALYDLYTRPGWVASLNQLQRRRFFALLERFVVPVPFGVARQVADLGARRRILPLVDLDAYSPDNGLGDWAGTGAATADIW